MREIANRWLIWIPSGARYLSESPIATTTPKNSASMLFSICSRFHDFSILSLVQTQILFLNSSKQTDLYEEIFFGLVESVLNGFNGTIFAYGQTGTGKTWTMEGIRNEKDKKGVIPNSFDHIFSFISRSNDQQYLVRAQYLEIYQEDIRDLLSKDQNQRLELKESPDKGVYVKVKL